MSRSLDERLARLEAVLATPHPAAQHTHPLVYYDAAAEIPALVQAVTCCPCCRVKVVLPRKEAR